MKDKNGVNRIQLTVDADGNPKMVMLDKNKEVIFHAP